MYFFAMLTTTNVYQGLCAQFLLGHDHRYWSQQGEPVRGVARKEFGHMSILVHNSFKVVLLRTTA